jgi:hypothetical protein
MADRHEIIEWHEGDGGSLGRNIQHDPRSMSYPFSEDLVTTIASVRHNRYGPILDQDLDITYKNNLYHGTGSCTGNAADGNLNTDPYQPTVPCKESTALDIYSAATEIDGFGSPWPTNDRGSSGLAVAKVCQKNGWIIGYQHVFSLNSMLKALQVTPVIIGANWYDSFDAPDNNGLVTIRPNASVRGGHEFQAIGVDVDKRQIEFVNSWGLGWGVQGHFFMSYDDVTRLLSEQGDVTVFVPLSQPAPTPVPPAPPTPTPTPPTPTPQPTPTPTPPTPQPTPTPSDVDQAMWNAIKKFFDEAKHWAEGKGWQ